ncbi:hypothetical protein JW933_03085 [candidate division FCPU426 bacterium]|nr:hypothetical protein [candidate division FCPU426 bacterium]
MKNLSVLTLAVLFIASPAYAKTPAADPADEAQVPINSQDNHPGEPVPPVSIPAQPAGPALRAQETRLLAMQKPAYEAETLFASRIYAHGGYGAFGNKITTYDGKTGYMAGGRGAWIINHCFLLGGGGYGATCPAIEREFAQEQKKLKFGYGGLELGYVFTPHRLLHFSLQALIGAGGIGYVEEVITGRDEYGNDIIAYEGEGDAFFVAEPMLYLEVNVTEWFRLCLGGGYRYVAGVDLKGVSNQDLSGASAELLFKFGYF